MKTLQNSPTYTTFGAVIGLLVDPSQMSTKLAKILCELNAAFEAILRVFSEL